MALPAQIQIHTSSRTSTSCSFPSPKPRIRSCYMEERNGESKMSSNMHQITGVIHQTSQGAQESAAAAAQLSGNAVELHRLVSQFEL